jgi:hypothetical protein
MHAKTKKKGNNTAPTQSKHYGTTQAQPTSPKQITQRKVHQDVPSQTRLQPARLSSRTAIQTSDTSRWPNQNI